MRNQEEENEEEKSEDKLVLNPNYRWLTLFAVMSTSGGNAMGWLAFAPIPGPTTEYFGITTNQVDFFSVLFMLVGIPVGFVAIWCADIIGLRKSIWIAGIFNLAGSLVRLSTLFHSELDAENNFVAAPSWCYPVALVGTAIMAVSQAFVLVIPTKMASQWFKGDQRLLSNSLSSLSNPLGMMVAAVTAPIIVKAPSDLWIQALIFAIPVALGLISSLFIPGEGNYLPAEELSFKQRLKYLFKEYRGEYILILLIGAIGVAHFSTKLTLLVQFLCPAGYDNAFSSSICASAIIVSGLI
ncbi:unnamed protein product [Oikopleura dioica]|uniref:Major facilitator superfamily (MFS) profile domain-containing protein n=1 Tax=Oikopleura dioica TaxID=34765 RepID=E4X6I9_OIKDI|nr:unnamed protein product [Oikopleura dioica]